MGAPLKRPRSRLWWLVWALTVLLGVSVFERFDVIVHAATCVGDTPCKACKNCKYCDRCAKKGGKCGTCRKSK
jgi:hypothetical protein